MIDFIGISNDYVRFLLEQNNSLIIIINKNLTTML